jgi:LPXTG-motif cell wall-anchored protein
MYILPKTGVGALVMTAVALAVTGIGAVLRWLGR